MRRQLQLISVLLILLALTPFRKAPLYAWEGLQTGAALQAPGYDSIPAPGSFMNMTTNPSVPVNATITVSETGNAALTITGITLSDPVNFTLLTPNTFTINDAGPAQAIVIRCNAATVGTFAAALTVAHNAFGSPATYTLICTVTTSPIVTPTITPIPFTPTPPPPSTGGVSEVKGQALRTGPYLGATLIGSVLTGQQYPILARSSDEGGDYMWFQIQVGSVVGWTSGRFFNFTGDANLLPTAGSIFDQIDNAPDTGMTTTVIALTDLRRRPSGRAKILATIPADTDVSVLGRTRQNGGNYWLQVRYDGKVGWIPAYVRNSRGIWSNVPIR